MSVSASAVKDLREKTGAGMMDCKKALAETNGDFEAAIDYLRTKGLATAAKKQGRVAAEGAVIALVEGNIGVVVEVNCETDFVSKGADFQNFANSVAAFAIKNKPATVEALKEATNADATELTLKCGEKVDVRKMALDQTEGVFGAYNHSGKIGALVNLNTTKASAPEVQDLAKDIAMHIAAADPKFLNSGDIDEAYKTREAEIYTAQLKEEGKPEAMIGKIVEGKLNKLAKEVCLNEQVFVKNPDLTIKKLVEEVSKKVGDTITIKSFYKINLGEGIEKKEDNLAEEVAKLTAGN